MKNKCEEIGFKHAWEDITEIFFPIGSANFQRLKPEKRQCFNCGKKEVFKTIQQEIKEWVDEDK